MAISHDIRAMLEARCRSRRTRRTQFTPQAPTDWRPQQLRDPRFPERYFTEDGAWEFIADQIGQGCPVDELTLKHPPGKKAYVMLFRGCPPVEKIYVKLQLGSDHVLGRSFHESTVSTAAEAPDQ